MLAVSACGSDKKSKTAASALAAASLSGTFVQACKPAGAYSVQGTLNFTGNIEVGTTNVYMDGNCGALGYSFSLGGTFVSGAAAVAPAGATKLDVVITEASLTPYSAAGADALNAASFCGLTNWTAGLQQNIIGRNCDGRTYNVGTTIYTIYGFYEESLFMGQIGSLGSSTDGSSDLSRPVSLGLPFARQ